MKVCGQEVPAHILALIARQRNWQFRVLIRGMKE